MRRDHSIYKNLTVYLMQLVKSKAGIPLLSRRNLNFMEARAPSRATLLRATSTWPLTVNWITRDISQVIIKSRKCVWYSSPPLSLVITEGWAEPPTHLLLFFHPPALFSRESTLTNRNCYYQVHCGVWFIWECDLAIAISASEITQVSYCFAFPKDTRMTSIFLNLFGNTWGAIPY